MVVPAVVVATTTAQYKNGWNDFAEICAVTAIRKMTMKKMLLSGYPQFNVMERASPPVSPSVVASILMTQNVSVTSVCSILPYHVSR